MWGVMACPELDKGGEEKLPRPTWTWKSYFLHVLNLKKALQIFNCCFEILSNLLQYFSLIVITLQTFWGHLHQFFESPVSLSVTPSSLREGSSENYHRYSSGSCKRIIGISDIVAEFNDFFLKSPCQDFGKNPILAIHHRKVTFCFLGTAWDIAVVGFRAEGWWHYD